MAAIGLGLCCVISVILCATIGLTIGLGWYDAIGLGAAIAVASITAVAVTDAAVADAAVATAAVSDPVTDTTFADATTAVAVAYTTDAAVGADTTIAAAAVPAGTVELAPPLPLSVVNATPSCMRATIVPPSPSPLASAPSAAPYDTPTDLDVWMQVDALQWLFGSPRPIWPPGLESHCLRALFDRIAVLAVDLAVTGYILDDQTLMAAAERHMPDSCSALRIIMRCPYPPTFAAYADEIIRLASLSGKAALYRDAMQRLETSIILPTAPVDVHDLYRQIHFTSVAAADWSRAMDGLHMDDCLLQLYLARALPVSYAPLRVTVRRVAPSTFGDYCAMLIVLASVDTARLGRGLPALSANATDAFDFLRELQNPLLTLPPPQSPQLPPMSSSLPSLMLPLPSPPPTLQAQAQLSPILPWSPLPTLQSPTLPSPPLESPLTPALADDASPGVTPVEALTDATVAVVADAATVTVAVADVTITLAAAVVVTSTVADAQPVIWPGGASTGLCPLRHWPLRHRPRLRQHRYHSVRHRHRPLGVPHCHRPALGTPYRESNLRACTQVRRGCHRVCSRMPRVLACPA